LREQERLDITNNFSRQAPCLAAGSIAKDSILAWAKHPKEGFGYQFLCIYGDARLLDMAELVTITSPPISRFNTYSATPAGEEAAAQLRKPLPARVVDYLDRVVELVQSVSFSELVSAIYKHYPEMRENSGITVDSAGRNLLHQRCGYRNRQRSDFWICRRKNYWATANSKALPHLRQHNLYGAPGQLESRRSFQGTFATSGLMVNSKTSLRAEQAMHGIGTRIGQLVAPYFQLAQIQQQLVGDVAATLTKSMIAFPVKKKPYLFTFDFNGAPKWPLQSCLS
jgi:hypothetical protein